jgi:polar amino acid transport system substrate-binding protein
MIKSTHQTSPKWRKETATTLQRLNQGLWTILLLVFCGAAFAQDATDVAFPGFRHVDPGLVEIAAPSPGLILLQADTDFAPWSFLGEDGRLRGISVELAIQACAEAKLQCSVESAAFSDLLPNLRSGKAQGLISGLKLDQAVASEFSVTRPYFRSLGRFVVRTGSPLAAPDVRTLAGRRIGFRANTTHARFLERFYGRSALTPFDSSQAMLEALRTGQVDAVFGDAVQLQFWLKGAASRDCCGFLGKAFVNRETFTRSLSFVLRRDVPELRARLDAALDKLETKGVTAGIIARYLPASVW